MYETKLPWAVVGGGVIKDKPATWVEKTFWGPRHRLTLSFNEAAIGAEGMEIRGIQTLALRMERHCQNAQALAQWLERERVAEPA